MSLKRSSNKILYTVRDTARPLWLLTLPFLALTLYSELSRLFGHIEDFAHMSMYVKPTATDGFYYSRMILSMEAIPYFIFILWACAFGMAAFGYLSSKKMSNVYFSLGMKKRDMFFSRFSGGLLPLATSVILAHIVNLVCNCLIFNVTHELIVMWIFDTFSFLFTMLCAYSVTVLAFVNACNIAEGIVFTGLFGISSPIITGAVEKLAMSNLIFGSANGSSYYNTNSNYTQTLWFLDIFGSYTDGCLTRCYVDVLHEHTVFDLNGMEAILGIVVGVAAFILIAVLAYLFFRKKTSETAGTILKSYNLYKIFFALLSVVVFCFSVDAFAQKMLSRYVCALLGTLVALVCILVGNLIFVRKISGKTLAVAAALYIGFAVCCFIGYNKPIPKAQDVKSVKVCASVFDPYISFFDEYVDYQYSTDDAFSVKRFDKYLSITLEDKEDIAWLMDVHSSIVSEGYITKSDEDASPVCFAVEYTLNDGTKIPRIYNFVGSKTRDKILRFSETKKGKEMNSYLLGEKNPYLFNDYSTDYLNNSVEKYFGYIKRYKDMTTDYLGTVSLDFSDDKAYDVIAIDKLGAYIGEATSEKLGKDFIKTLRSDLEKRTTEQRYFHSASDEVCKLYLNFDHVYPVAYYYAENNLRHLVGDGNFETIGQVTDQLVDLYYLGCEMKNRNGYYVIEDDEYYDEDQYVIYNDSYDYNSYTIINGKEPKKGDFEKFADMLDRIYDENREDINRLAVENISKDTTSISVVITKDMTNTVKLLEEKGILISSHKISEKPVKARIAKFDDIIMRLYTGDNCIKNTIDEYELYRCKKEYRYSSENPVNVFGNNYITDPKKLDYLVDNSLIFYGKAFGNYVVEFILEDGTQVSKMIPAELVKDIV